jgi:LmbE family N-acetylglucosaminyl deacetylase
VNAEVVEGTPESMWRSWAGLREIPALTLPSDSRVVVIAPHPDDETLALGGLLATYDNCALIAVTDGEASHPRSTVLTPDQLGERRRAERVDALARLGRPTLPCDLLGHRDGAIDESLLAEQLAGLLRAEDICVTTWRGDRHPDHEAVGRAAALAAEHAGIALWEYPVWMWHWAWPGDERVPWQRARALRLSESARARKRDATRAFRSQLEPLGAGEDEAAIVAPAVLEHFDRDVEIVFVP